MSPPSGLRLVFGRMVGAATSAAGLAGLRIILGAEEFGRYLAGAAALMFCVAVSELGLGDFFQVRIARAAQGKRTRIAAHLLATRTALALISALFLYSFVIRPNDAAFSRLITVQLLGGILLSICLAVQVCLIADSSPGLAARMSMAVALLQSSGSLVGGLLGRSAISAGMGFVVGGFVATAAGLAILARSFPREDAVSTSHVPPSWRTAVAGVVNTVSFGLAWRLPIVVTLRDGDTPDIRQAATVQRCIDVLLLISSALYSQRLTARSRSESNVPRLPFLATTVAAVGLVPCWLLVLPLVSGVSTGVTVVLGLMCSAITAGFVLEYSASADVYLGGLLWRHALMNACLAVGSCLAIVTGVLPVIAIWAAAAIVRLVVMPQLHRRVRTFAKS